MGIFYAGPVAEVAGLPEGRRGPTFPAHVGLGNDAGHLDLRRPFDPDRVRLGACDPDTYRFPFLFCNDATRVWGA